MRGPAAQAVAEGFAITRQSPARALALASAAAAILAGLPLAWFLLQAHGLFPNRPVRAVSLIFIVLAVSIALLVSAYWRIARDLSKVSLLGLAATAVALTGIYFYWVSFYVSFPADILVWSEGDYVNDILKFRAGYPLYSPQANNESFTYVPGTQLTTYAIALAAGHPLSIAAYRLIHVCYTVLAALIALLAVHKVLEIAGEGETARSPLWNALWAPLLFLMGTNGLTARFTAALHDDALSELVNAVAFYLVVAYTAQPKRRLLVMMALLPAIGFLVKQSLAAWAGLFTVYLLVFDGEGRQNGRAESPPQAGGLPHKAMRAAVFAVASFGAVAAVFGGCYALWGSDFAYWTVQVLGHHGVVPLRSVEHALDIWPYIAVGVAGGVVMIQRSKALAGPWLVWAALMMLSCYTSGVAWMLNHIGPASLLAGVWLCAGLAYTWPSLFHARESWQVWVRAGATVAVLLMLFSGLALVRIPAEPFTPDAYRYIHDIENQFAGERTDRVLLDAGSWVYVRQGVVMKDRAPSIGERGYSQTGDFSGIIGRIRSEYYDKILVRGFHSPDFWYDTATWERPSGIRQALLDSYREVATIRGVQRPASERDHAEDYYLFGDVSVLAPKREMESHGGQNLGTDSHFQRREMVSVPVLQRLRERGGQNLGTDSHFQRREMVSVPVLRVLQQGGAR